MEALENNGTLDLVKLLKWESPVGNMQMLTVKYKGK